MEHGKEQGKEEYRGGGERKQADQRKQADRCAKSGPQTGPVAAAVAQLLELSKCASGRVTYVSRRLSS